MLVTESEYKRMIHNINIRLEKAMELSRLKKSFSTYCILSQYREVINGTYIEPTNEMEVANSCLNKKISGMKLVNLSKVPTIYWYAIACNRRINYAKNNPWRQIIRIAKHGKKFWNKPFYQDIVSHVIEKEDEKTINAIKKVRSD